VRAALNVSRLGAEVGVTFGAVAVGVLAETVGEDVVVGDGVAIADGLEIVEGVSATTGLSVNGVVASVALAVAVPVITPGPPIPGVVVA
jgi:UDP-3-O-[3-hydroxymyristoyl] glucosamine N-acyltransferase